YPHSRSVQTPDRISLIEVNLRRLDLETSPLARVATMRLRNVYAAILICGLALLPACGTRAVNGSKGGGGGSTAPVPLAITDPPPSGITVLSFTITVSSATLQ